MATPGVEQVGVEYVTNNINQYMKNVTIANNATNQFGKILDVVAGAGTTFFNSITKAGGGLINLGLTLAPFTEGGSLLVTVLGFLTKGMGELGNVAMGIIGIFVRIAQTIGGIVVSAFKGLYNIIAPVVTSFVNLVKNVLNAVNPFQWLADALSRISYISIGIITADAIRSIGQFLKDMAADALNAASNFQLLTIRLQGLLARDLVQSFEDGSMSMSRALVAVQDQTQSLFKWLTKLAVLSPFTVTDVSEAFTLAEAYGLGADMAKELTTATLNFAAGMGLEGDAIRRVIENMGQMMQQGKVTGTELRDLARGSFVPNTEVLKIMAEQYGLTVAEMKNIAATAKASATELAKMSKASGMTVTMLKAWIEKGGLVGDYMRAFIKMVGQDFPGAAERMSRTLTALKSNIKDLIQTYLGLLVLKPMLDVIVAPLADLLNTVLADQRVIYLIERIGAALVSITKALMPNINASKGADAIVLFLSKIVIFAEKVQKLATDIRFFWDIINGTEDQGIKESLIQNALEYFGVPQWIIDSINNLWSAWNNIKIFWAENGDTIKGYIDEVAAALGFKDFSFPDTVVNFTQRIEDFSNWLIDNKQSILNTMAEVAAAINHFVTVTIPLLQGNAIQPPLENGAFNSGAGSGQLTWLDNLAIKVHEITEDLGLLYTNITNIAKATWLSPETLGNMKSVADSLDRIGAVFGMGKGNAGKGLLNYITAFVDVWSRPSVSFWSALAYAMNSIATTLERIQAIYNNPEKVSLLDVYIEHFKNGWANAAAIVVPAVEGMMQSIYDDIIGKMKEVIAYLTGVGGKSKAGKGGGLLQDFYNAGSNLIQGLLDGMKSKWQDVMTWLTTLIKEIIATIEGLLDENSPSKVTYRIGENIMRGLQLGMDKFSTLPLNAMGSATNRMMQPLYASPATQAAQNYTNNVNNNASLWFPQFNLQSGQDMAAMLASLGQVANV